MNKKAALIITHGSFGIELLKSVEMIMGAQEDALALGINPGDDVDTVRAEAEKIIHKSQSVDRDTIVFVDIFGGSPSNIGLYLLKKFEIKLITGVNMMMLIELFSSREVEELEILVEKVINAGTEGIKKFEKTR